ncbi:hypothetical protein [Allisonella histaminiformans]|uniref:hypothetical protein n=1 Tax=Allisonella histaminiformans TaxID=209880 RepID=UPI002804987C|nr:hypothetical protein [Allisonella histaminiformans]
MKISKQVETAIETICDEYEDVAIYLHDGDNEEDFLVTENFSDYNFILNVLRSCVAKISEVNGIPLRDALILVIEGLCEENVISDDDLIRIFNSIFELRLKKCKLN